MDPFARLLYIAMWNWADDSGVGVANPRELLGFAFPLDEEITVEDLRRMLVEIRRVFGVNFYTVAGRQYYSIPSWEKHQKFDRRSKGKHPGPDEAEHVEIPADKGKQEHSTESHESTSSHRRDSVAGTGEQGNRGTEEQSSSSEVSDETPRPDVDVIVQGFSELLMANDVKHKPGKSWHEAARLLIDKDGYTPEQIMFVARFAATDGFWKSNILSVPKLREKFEALKLKAQAQGKATATKPTTSDKMRETLSRGQALQDRLNNSADQTILQIGA